MSCEESNAETSCTDELAIGMFLTVAGREIFHETSCVIRKDGFGSQVAAEALVRRWLLRSLLAILTRIKQKPAPERVEPLCGRRFGCIVPEMSTLVG